MFSRVKGEQNSGSKISFDDVFKSDGENKENSAGPKSKKSAKFNLVVVSGTSDDVDEEDDEVKPMVAKEPKKARSILKKPNTGSALKSNPLAVRAKMEEEDDAEDGEEEAERAYMAYAEMHYERHEGVKPDDMMRFTRTPIPGPLLIMEGELGEVLKAEAIECFNQLLTALEPPQLELGMAAQILIATAGLKNTLIRDEIYAQLCRQCTRNPDVSDGDWVQIESRAWQTMLLVCSSFSPTKSFLRALNAFLKARLLKYTSDTSRSNLVKMVRMCQQGVKQIGLNGCRKFPPSLAEINAAKMGVPVSCRIYTPDGRFQIASILPYGTASEVIKKVAAQMTLQDPGAWSLYEVRAGSPDRHVIQTAEYIADIISFWEAVEASQGIEPNSERVVGDGPLRLELRKRLFKSSTVLTDDPVDFDLTYHQIMEDYLAGFFPVDDMMALQLAAIKCQIDIGDASEEAYQNMYAPYRDPATLLI